MATSASVDFTLNRNQIISSALRKLRAIDPNTTADANDITTGAEALNLMIKAWQMDGLSLWFNQEVVLHLAYNTQTYLVGPSGAHCAALSDAGYTQLASAAASGAGTLTVDSITGIADADAVGIQLDGGTIQWTTVNGSPSGSTVTLTDNTTGAAAVDNYVFHYTTLIGRPVEIIEARVRNTDDNDSPLRIIHDRHEFMAVTDKTSQGEVQEIYYDPFIVNGLLYVWPIAGSGDITDRIVMTVRRVVEDFDAQANNFDGPVEALDALIWNLSVQIAPEYGANVSQMVMAKAIDSYDKLKRFYQSIETMQFTP